MKKIVSLVLATIMCLTLCMKKGISILLSLSLILSLCPYALATDNYKPDATSSSLNYITVSEAEILAILPAATEYDEIYNQVVTDLIDLSSAYIEADLCTPVSIGQDGLVRYNITFPNGIVNQITTNRNANGCIVLHFYEGDLHNEVIVLANGNLLVDGQLVDIQNTSMTTQSYIEPSNNAVTPRMRNAEFSLSPWGKASDYTNYRSTDSANTCSWGISTLVGVVTGVVATIICSAVNATLGVSIGSSIFSGVASAMITRCEIYGMEDAYFSWEFDKYERKDSMSIDRYYQFTGYCYSRRDHEGHAFPHTYYYHNWFS